LGRPAESEKPFGNRIQPPFGGPSGLPGRQLGPGSISGASPETGPPASAIKGHPGPGTFAEDFRSFPRTGFHPVRVARPPGSSEGPLFTAAGGRLWTPRAAAPWAGHQPRNIEGVGRLDRHVVGTGTVPWALIDGTWLLGWPAGLGEAAHLDHTTVRALVPTAGTSSRAKHPFLKRTSGFPPHHRLPGGPCAPASEQNAPLTNQSAWSAGNRPGVNMAPERPFAGEGRRGTRRSGPSSLARLPTLPWFRLDPGRDLVGLTPASTRQGAADRRGPVSRLETDVPLRGCAPW